MPSSSTPLRIAPVFMVALLVATPWLGTVDAQLPSLVDIAVPKGSVKIIKDSKPVNFLSGNDTFVLQVQVQNRAAGSVTDIPVYFWVDGVDSLRNCRKVSLPSGGTTNNPTSVTFQHTFKVDPNLAPTNYVFTVSANLNPGSAGPSWSGFSCGTTVSEIGDATQTNNIAWGHFVKDKRLDYVAKELNWCRWVNEQCSTAMWDGSEWYNTTSYTPFDPEDPETAATYFSVVVENHGEWKDIVDYSSATGCRSSSSTGAGRFTPTDCPDHYVVPGDVRITGPGLTDALVLPFGEAPTLREGNATVWGTDFWPLHHLAGNFSVVATIDPLGKTVQNATVNDAISMTAHVRHTEFRATINATDFRTTLADPYPFDSLTRIKGDIVFWNDGTANLTVDRPLLLRAYIDSPTGHFVKTETLTRTSSGNAGALNTGAPSRTFTVDWLLSTQEGATNYLAPGKHKLVAEIDYDNAYKELNEADNRVEIDLYIEDEGAPVFPTDVTNPLIRLVRNPNGLPANTGASDTVLHPHDPFAVIARVDDSDVNLKVVATFTLKNDSNVTRVYDLTRTQTGANQFARTIRDFQFLGHNETSETSQNWTLRVYAEDPSGNSANSSTVAFRLDKWPIHTVDESAVMRETPPHGMPNNHTMPWTDLTGPRFHIELRRELTGLEPHNFSQNLGIDIDPPGDDFLGAVKSYRNGTGWQHPNGENDRCDDPSAKPGQSGINETIPRIDPSNPGHPCPHYGQWLFAPSQYDGRPGKWNVTILIADSGGNVRAINRTFTMLDELPDVVSFVVEQAEVAAGETINVTSEIVEDFSTSAVYANFTRSDGQWRNVTLTRSNVTDAGQRERSWWNMSIPTGRGEVFGIAGNFSVQLAAVDENGNWGHSVIRNVLVVDSVAPSITAAGATPTAQEVGGNVTFFAVVTDQTEVRVILNLYRGGEEVRNHTLEHTHGNNYTLTLEFDDEATYAWEIIAYDGNPNGGLASNKVDGTLMIRDNLGPRFVIVDPSFTFNGERFGRASQRIQVIAYDGDGVDESTINMTIDGVQITPEVTAAPSGYKGHTLTYAVPLSAGYGHNDTVTVSISAIDLSNKTLAGDTTFTYRVDNTPPISRVISFEPRYRELESHAWNISLETLFTLQGLDNDGMPTGVEAIRYQILGSSAGSTLEAVYSTPFTIESIPGAYTGPRPYFVEFFAEDDVGNKESRNRFSVQVDVTPPALDRFGSLPQGRYVNATFIDDRSGVERAVAWYSINGSPYQPLALEENQGVWSGIIPEGRKGEWVSYYLQAWDRVGNTEKVGNEEEPYSSYPVGNRLPLLRITNPLLGETVSRVLPLTWTASDQDDDPLNFIVYMKAPGRANFVELARIDVSSQRVYQLDTTRYTDGQYTLALTASDGSFVARSETTVTFLNSGRAVGNVTTPGSGIKPGEGVLITAEITKAQARVEARIYRDGELVDAFAMNDEGRDGDLIAGDNIFSVRVALARAGNYNVEIFTQYQEGGETKEARIADAARFTVQLTPGAIMTEYALLWVALVTLALAAIGIAGFGLYRKWR